MTLKQVNLLVPAANLICYFIRNRLQVQSNLIAARKRLVLCGGHGSVGVDLAALSTFLGNDYIDRLYGIGPVKSAQLTKEFIDWEENEEQRRDMINTLAATLVWNRGDTEKAADFAEKFWHSYYLLRHPPVFKYIQRYIMWVLPCGLSVTYTPLFLGRKGIREITG